MATETPAQLEGRLDWRGLLRYWAVAVVVVALVVGFRVVLAALYQRWVLDEPSGGGPLVPVAAGYLAWQVRDRLALTPARGDNRGLAVLALGVLAFWAGAWANIFLPQGLALLLVGWGTVLWLGGAQWARLLAFPFFLLFFMLPLPLTGPVTVPVQVALTAAAGHLSAALGIPVQTHGTQIVMQGQSISVDPGCAGMRFLLTLLAAAFFVAHLTDTTLGRRATVVALSVPLAVVINLARIELSILMGRAFGPAAAEGVSHATTGLIVFAVGVICLTYMARWICGSRTGAG
jgi:exosortase